MTEPSRTLTGRLDAQTTLRAELGGPGAIADSVHSQTRFTVRQAVLHGIDLVQAVKSVGPEPQRRNARSIPWPGFW